MLEVLILLAQIFLPAACGLGERTEHDKTLLYVFVAGLFFLTGFSLLFAYLASIYH